MGALAILALIEAGVKLAQQITDYIQTLKHGAIDAGATVEEIEAAVAKGRAAAGKVISHADRILTEHPEG